MSTETKMSLAGKFAAVTGATSGIGLACAKAFLNAGATVYLIHYSGEKLDVTCKHLGDKAIPLAIDVTDPEQVNSMMPTILKKTGGLDFFIANAGKYVGGDLVKNEPKDLAAMLDVNVNGAVLTSQAVVRVMKQQQRGYIIFISSIAGQITIPGEAGYCGSKAFVENFAQSLRREICGDGVRVGVVSPGPVDGKIVEENWTSEKLATERAKGGFLSPADVAGAVLYMAMSDRNMVVSNVTILPSSFNL